MTADSDTPAAPSSPSVRMALDGSAARSAEHVSSLSLSLKLSSSVDITSRRLLLQLDAALAPADGQVPSLAGCESLSIKGPVTFSPGTSFVGNVVITNNGTQPKSLPAGTYENKEVAL